MASNESTVNTSYNCLRIQGQIVVARAMHIGSGQASIMTDASIRRNNKGQPYIPGSSLAGLFRSLAEEFAPYLCPNPDQTIRGLFGSNRGKKPADKDMCASRLQMQDAYLLTDLPSGIEVRDYVGIDRRRAAARTHLKYDREVSPGNTRYEFELSLEDGEPDDLRLVLAVLDFWSNCGLQIGGRTTTGLGEAKVERLRFYGVNFKQASSLTSYLLGGGNDAHSVAGMQCISSRPNVAPYINPSPPPAPQECFCSQHLFLTIALVLEEPLLVKGSIPEVHELTEEGEIRNLPSDERSSDAEFITALTYQSNGTLEPEFYIPGSSIKGVLRTRAEKIIRTLNFYRDYTTLEEAEANADTYPDRITACAITHANDDDSNLEACFGEPEKQKQASKKLPYQLYEGSCVTCRLFGNAMMRGRLTCSEAVTVQNLTPKLFDHVAIDRFTGGAADAKKFDTRPLMPVTNASTLTNDQAFTFKIHLERPELWMIGLLGHLLKDLNSGDIRIGHATRRGYGRVRGFITDAKLLALPGTKLLQACSEAKLPTRTFGAYGPYKEIILSDWLNLFSHTPWGAAGPVDRDTSGAGLLAIADEEFQKLVKEAEDQHWRMT